DKSSNDGSNVQTESNWRNLVSRWINMFEDESNEEDIENNESNSN
ncbi:4129_t:CDS:1, partial [Funneliformis geosporum]